jgi:hypothetical protein
MIGLRRFLKAQNDPHHFLNLFFVGAGNARHPLLYHVGPEFMHGQAAFGKGGEYHTP